PSAAAGSTTGPAPTVASAGAGVRVGSWARAQGPPRFAVATTPAPPPGRTVAGGPGAAAALPPPARAGAATGFKVQLGSVRSEADARKLWDGVRRKHPTEIGSLTAHFSRVDFPDRGTFYRVHAGTLPSRDAARDMCARLQKAGTVCIVVAPN
ncbi:MAG: SPOR domain-containing protein, partial [Alphaproteobacteria bacterium]